MMNLLGTKLTPFEAYMLADDTSDHPMSFFFRLEFVGELEITRFQRALREVVWTHEQLRSLVHRARGWSRPYWISNENLDVHVDAHTAGKPLLKSSMPYLDVSRQSGVRAWFDSAQGRTEIWFQFHHSCCDAIGAMEFLEQLFAAYSRSEPSPGVDVADTVTRPASRSSQANRRGRPGVTSLRRTWKFARNRPIPVPTAIRDDVPDHHGFPAHLSCYLGEYEKLRIELSTAADTRLTLNDWLLTAVLAGLGHWCEDLDCDKDHCIRVAVPINLRNPNGKNANSGNCVSMVFIDRTVAQTLQSELLSSIADETADIKQGQLGSTMLTVLSVLTAFPPVLKYLLAHLSCPNTTVLSNLGQIFPSDNELSPERRKLLGAVLDSVDFLPPIRRGVHVAFGAFTYAGQTKLCMHYDPRRLVQAEADRLLSNVVQIANKYVSRCPVSIPSKNAARA